MAPRLEFSRKTKSAIMTHNISMPRASSKNFKWLAHIAESTSHDDCINWPFSKRENGYGQIFWRGKRTTTNRVVCILSNGEPINNKLEAAHSCGNSLCCNPNHISWKTPKDNRRDKIMHGTHIQGEQISWSKLKEEDVRLIKSELIKNMTSLQIARTYGVSRSTIDDIKKRASWKHVE
ncbi:hypothetical protein ABID20_004498 [Rhizobium alvei]